MDALTEWRGSKLVVHVRPEFVRHRRIALWLAVLAFVAPAAMVTWNDFVFYAAMSWAFALTALLVRWFAGMEHRTHVVDTEAGFVQGPSRVPFREVVAVCLCDHIQRGGGTRHSVTHRMYSVGVLPAEHNRPVVEYLRALPEPTLGALAAPHRREHVDDAAALSVDQQTAHEDALRRLGSGLTMHEVGRVMAAQSAAEGARVIASVIDVPVLDYRSSDGGNTGFRLVT